MKNVMNIVNVTNANVNASTITKQEIRQAIEGIIDSFNAARDAGKSPERLTAEIIGGFLFRASEEGNGVLYYNPIGDCLSNESDWEAIALPFDWKFEWIERWDYELEFNDEDVIDQLVDEMLTKINEICQHYWARH